MVTAHCANQYYKNIIKTNNKPNANLTVLTLTNPQTHKHVVGLYLKRFMDKNSIWHECILVSKRQRKRTKEAGNCQAKIG